MEQLKLAAQTGRAIGSASSRRLRAENKIPAVMYGHGTDPVPLTLDRLRFRSALNAAGPNAIITLANRVTHVDFLLISLDERLVVDVPVHIVGEAVVAGRQGAVVQQQLMSLTVESPAGVIPPTFEVDVSELSLDNPIRVSDLPLPEGMVSQVDIDTLVVIAQRSRAAIAAGLDDDDDEDLGEDDDALDDED